jgi:adenylate cyclase
MLDTLASPRLQPLRLASGLTMFAFAALHFTNHAVGLIGLDAMNAVQDWRLALTHSTLARVILLAAILTHIGLGLGKLAARRTLRMPPMEQLQIASGILIPALLIPHVTAMGYFSTTTNFFYSYTSVAYLLWPGQALWQSALLLVVWLHGCIGLNYWFRVRPWYGRWRYVLLAAAVALPLLALTGFMAAAREAHALLADADKLATARADLHWPTETVGIAMRGVRDTIWMTFAGLLTLVLATIAARRLAARGAPMLAVSYAGGPTLRVPVGPSLLEISRMNGIPHTSICGGRARCSTCRVRIDRGAADLAPPEPAECATLARIGASPNVRLACQLRPTRDLGVTRLVAPSTRAGSRSGHGVANAEGVEKAVAILFLDVRGFTRMSEHRLPFDVVFLLNQFFATVGEAIRAEGGWIDKYMGDGLMAVFGRDSGVESGCREALAAARAIDLALDGLNRRLATEVAEGIRIGIGIHAGPVVIGHIGEPGSAALTVIGRIVNEASRLEALTKERGCQLIISADVARHAGVDLADCVTDTVEVRGGATKIDIVIVSAARDLQSTSAPSIG